MGMQWMLDAGELAGAASAVLGLLGLLLIKPIRRRVQARKDARAREEREKLAFRAELRETLGGIHDALAGLSDDIGDLQYERLSQAQDFYTTRGWCPGAKKEMLCKMHASYRAKGRNHLSRHYEEEILRLADKPEKEEDE